MPRNRAKVEFGLLCDENRSSAIIRRDICFWGEAASFEILRAWIRSAKRAVWAWTTLDIDEDIMHPVERPPRRSRRCRNRGGERQIRGYTRSIGLYPLRLSIRCGFFTDKQERETLSRIDGDAIALCFSPCPCLTASQIQRVLSSLPGYLWQRDNQYQRSIRVTADPECDRYYYGNTSVASFGFGDRNRYLASLVSSSP